VAVARSSPLVAPRAVIVSPSKASEAASEACDPAAKEVANTTGFGFGSSLRLHKTDEFSSVFAFRRVLRGRHFALHYSPNSAGTPRLGLVVAKKLAKRAVQRNLVKRLGRDVFRHAQASLPSYDLVLRLSAKLDDVTKRGMREEMIDLLGRLNAKVNATHRKPVQGDSSVSVP
jgi:ribonuclease P protein component